MTDVLEPWAERPLLIELAGEIDMANAGSLGDCLCQAIDLTGSGLVVDLAAVTFIDSSGMAMMLRVHRVAATRQVTVRWRGMQPFPAKALAMTGLDRVLAVEE
jgi:anti-sigma B factor antagonist